ncbi:hypothetical protein ACRALDRAFT_1069765 [Sodiomyces alcalophilus JCM 7366]|uniref:uncharacterized protein n=1 Tax=Sodiomyces alcalophilus JCM 7366 TaxID=591952 RepID=UPI0039B3CACD
MVLVDIPNKVGAVVAAKKAAPTKKGAIKTGRVAKTAKKNTRKAAKDTANTAAAANTTTTAATPNAAAEGSGSSATAPKERYSAKNPPPDFVREKFDTPCGYKCHLYPLVVVPIARRAAIAEKEVANEVNLLNRLRPALRLS